jgi:hypothetical protein
VKLKRLNRNAYLSETLEMALTEPEAGDEVTDRVGGTVRDGVVGMGPAAPTILTAFFLSFKLPVLAAG